MTRWNMNLTEKHELIPHRVKNLSIGHNKQLQGWSYENLNLSGKKRKTFECIITYTLISGISINTVHLKIYTMVISMTRVKLFENLTLINMKPKSLAQETLISCHLKIRLVIWSEIHNSSYQSHTLRKQIVPILIYFNTTTRV